MSELSLVVKATLILMAGLLATRAVRGMRASVRHVVLASTFGALLVLPLAAAVAPQISVEMAFLAPAGPARSSGQVESTAAAPRVDSTASAAAVAIDDASSAPSRVPTLRTLLIGVWALGAASILGSLLLSFWRLRQITRRALPWIDARSLVSDLAAAVGVRRSIDIVLHEGLGAPLTCGVLRPTIVLPVDAPAWSDADVRRALVHELAHVHRGDWIVLLVSHAVRIAYWFHPLVWMAQRQLALEAEHACDDEVIGRSERTEYAEQLVSLAQRMRQAPQHAALAMATRSDLSTRVSAVLDTRQRRGRAGMRSIAMATTAAIAVVMTVAPLRAVRGSSPEPANAVVAEQSIGGSQGAGQGAGVGSGQGAGTRETRRADRRLLPPVLIARRDIRLVAAADHGDIAYMTDLLTEGANVNAAVPGDGSPLIAAARAGRLDAVQWLLERGADLDLGVLGDGSPLIAAAVAGHTEIAALLLDRGASIDQIVDGDENALIGASGAGRLQIVQLLVGRGADVNARAWAVKGVDPSVGEWRTPLNMARRGGHRDVVAFLVSAGAR